MTDKSPDNAVLELYRGLIQPLHPDQVTIWPLISGHNVRIGGFKNWLIVIFTHTGNSGVVHSTGVGELPAALIGVDSIDDTNKEAVRRRIERHFMLEPRDGVVFIDSEGRLANSELIALMRRHELALGLVPMKIFLSHKGVDKDLVRDYEQTLRLLGFQPWLDEEAMPAGTPLHRGIRQGFADSCAAVFFVTPSFVDEKYLATEVNYAIEERTARGDQFAIITIRFGGGEIPTLLRQFVWREHRTDLQALREIIRALPLRLGDVGWRREA